MISVNIFLSHSNFTYFAQKIDEIQPEICILYTKINEYYVEKCLYGNILQIKGGQLSVTKVKIMTLIKKSCPKFDV